MTVAVGRSFGSLPSFILFNEGRGWKFYDLGTLVSDSASSGKLVMLLSIETARTIVRIIDGSACIDRLSRVTLQATLPSPGKTQRERLPLVHEVLY